MHALADFVIVVLSFAALHHLPQEHRRRDLLQSLGPAEVGIRHHFVFQHTPVLILCSVFGIASGGSLTTEALMRIAGHSFIQRRWILYTYHWLRRRTPFHPISSLWTSAPARFPRQTSRFTHPAYSKQGHPNIISRIGEAMIRASVAQTILARLSEDA